MLFSIKKILVCVDLREDCQAFLMNVEVLRSKCNAAVDVLFVSDVSANIEWVYPVFKEEDYYSSLMGEMKRLMSKRLEDNIKAAGLKAKPLILEGRPVDKILEVSGNYDLLIITHKTHKHFHHFLGGAARKIIASIDIPVMVINRDIHFDKVACLIEPSMKHEWLITSTFDFYRTMHFKDVEFISLWHHLPEPFQNEKRATELSEQLQEDINYFRHEGERATLRFEPTQELQIADHAAQIIEEDHVDLAVMGRTRGKKTEKIFLGSETLRMLEHRPTNLLVLPV